MIHKVVFAPEAEAQLVSLYAYIASASSPRIAANYTERIVAYCESLRTFPHRGLLREDIRPGLRITNYRKRAVIAFIVGPDTVSILGIFYGGQNYEAVLSETDEGS